MSGRSFPPGAAVLVAVAVVLVGLLTSFFYRQTVDISRSYPDDPALYLSSEAEAPRDTVYLGVISRYPSSLIYEGYQPLIDYLTGATPHHFALRLSESYEETVRQLVDGEVAAAFIGSYLYVQASAEHGVTSILQPVDEQGEPTFHSVLVTRRESDVRSMADLAGRRLALPSELSFSANWLSNHELAKVGLRLDDLAAVHHFPHHHTVIYEVLRGNFDAGIVKGRVAREFLDRGIRVVARSDPLPGSPVVVPADHDAVVTGALVTALLAVDPGDPTHAEMLESWDPEFAYGFAVARDEDYDGIRSLLRRQGGGG